MRVRAVLVLLLVSVHKAISQTNEFSSNILSLTLGECIDSALKQNLDLQIQRRTTELAGLTLSSAYGPYDPIFSFSARRDFISQPAEFDPKKSGFDFPYRMTTDTAGPDLRGVLPIGLSYDFKALAGEHDARTDFLRSPTNGPPFRRTNDFFASAGVTATQHLLRDSWIDESRTLILVRRKDLKISEQTMRLQLMQVVLAVELAYDDLIAARELLRVQEKALELKRQFVAETRRRVQVGDAPPLDTEQAETQLELTRTALIAAREQVIGRQNQLKRLISNDFGALLNQDVIPAQSLVETEPLLDRAESFRAALMYRPDLAQARLAVERSDVEIRFTRNQLLPHADLFGHYGSLGINDGFRAAESDALHFRDHEYSYGVIFTIPLTRIKERSDYHASNARKEIAQLQLQRVEQDLFLQIADLVNRAQSRFSQVGSARRARAYAESALAAEEKKLQNGLTTSFVVLQLQETLTAARTTEVQALADYNKVLAQLAFAEGRTLERNSLELQWK